MCGRITNNQELDANARDFDAEVEPLTAWKPSYNIAPTQDLLAVGLRDGRRALRALRWGLIPSWAKDATIAARCINARSETIAEMPSYRDAFRKRRCVVLVSGWYEWKGEGKAKRPHWFHGAHGELLALAGLWERWKNPSTGEEVRTCVVATCAPNEAAAAVHNRMPVVLDRSEVDAWLRADAPRDQLLPMLRPCPSEWLGVYEVDRRVGSPRENDEGLIVRAA